MSMTTFPLSTVESTDVLARAQAGDERAFIALVSSYQARVFRWAFALTGDRDDADDVTQEVFVRVYRKLGGFRGDGSLDAWLYRITRRVALRSQRAVSPRTNEGESDVYITDPGARIDRQQAFDLIRSMAGALPMRQREVFVLCDLEGRTPSEAAAILRMKDVSVRASLFKARAAIRRRIIATHPAYGDEP